MALLIGEEEIVEKTASNLAHLITLSDLPDQAAEHLYEALHQLDQLKAHAILIELPPATEVWAAILDRLTRAGYRDNN